jgi:DNA-directed RNA polymerase specialized sigma subunit
VNNLEEDLGHKVSAEELSAYLEMPMEEIRDILRMSGDQIDVDGK